MCLRGGRLSVGRSICLLVPSSTPGLSSLASALGSTLWRFRIGKSLLALLPYFLIPKLSVHLSLCSWDPLLVPLVCPPTSLPGLSKTSDQAYIEFESIEAIVKTASRTKFFIEFYSTCLEGPGWGPGLGVSPGEGERGPIAVQSHRPPT